jgi:hypothetical protein
VPAATIASIVGAGEQIANDAAGALGALSQDIARVPCRRALFLECLVGVVDHDRRVQIGNRCECSDATAHDHAPAGRGPRPRRGALRVVLGRVQQRDGATFPFEVRARLRARPASATQTIVDPSREHISATCARDGERRRPHHPLTTGWTVGRV